jgi:hypothetical protein
VRRHREDRHHLFGGHAEIPMARPGRDHELRPRHRARQLAGGLSAAGFPQIAKRKGAKLVILSDPTDQDDDADVVIHAETDRP